MFVIDQNPGLKATGPERNASLKTTEGPRMSYTQAICGCSCNKSLAKMSRRQHERPLRKIGRTANLVIDLKVRGSDKVLGPGSCVVLDEVKDVFDRPWNDSSSLGSRVAFHGVGFPRPSLSVSYDRGIIAFQRGKNCGFCGVVVNVLLWGVLVVNVVERKGMRRVDNGISCKRDVGRSISCLAASASACA
jgi:hypothetical protein